MAITGWKSPAMFKRYNTVSRDELKAAALKIGMNGHSSEHPGKLDTNEGRGKA
jgi:hypothetical protein